MRPLEDWSTCIKAHCSRCDLDVRAEFLLDHLFIVHAIEPEQAELVRV